MLMINNSINFIIMFKKEIIRENGQILEVIWQDAYGRHKDVTVLGTYDEDKPKKNEKKVKE